MPLNLPLRFAASRLALTSQGPFLTHRQEPASDRSLQAIPVAQPLQFKGSPFKIGVKPSTPRADWLEVEQRRSVIGLS